MSNKYEIIKEAISIIEKTITAIEDDLEISNNFKKVAYTGSSTQPSYIDEKGNVFTAARIVAEGFKPKGKIKGYSWSEKVNDPKYGTKVRRG